MSIARLMQMAASGQGGEPDPFFNQTTLLLHGDGTNGAQNNTFLDSSTNNFTITRNGNTTQGTFSPFSLPNGEWSNYLPGSGSILYTGVSTALSFDADFTVEGWFNLANFNNASAGGNPGLIGFGTPNWVLLCPGGEYTFYANNSIVFATSTVGITANTWHHFALVRSGSTITMYHNGTSVATATNSNTLNIGASGVTVGSNGTGGIGAVTGYISNIRVVKGTAVYTSAFTPPTEPLTAIANTQLLVCQSNRFKDNSSNNFSVTLESGPSVQPFSPFLPTAAYSASVNGGSGYFDGLSDNLTAASDAAFSFGTGDFTWEAWIYKSGAWVTTAGTFEIMYATPTTNGFVVGRNDGNLIVRSFGVANVSSTPLPPANSWNHIVSVRSGTTLSLYVNGIRVDTDTDSTNFAQSSIAIGNDGSGSSYLGYISNLRVVKGTAIYDPTLTTLTVPTSPVTAVSGTSLLCNFTNAGIFDNTGKNNLETVGNAQIDTTTKKYGTGSMEFDGTGDWLKIPESPNLNLGTTNLTIECWLYITAAIQDYRMILADGSSNNYLALRGGGTGGRAEIYINGNAFLFDLNNSISQNTWHHFAVVRSGTTFTVYVDGSSLGTNTSSAAWNIGNGGTFVGRWGGATAFEWPGFIDDLRITKGVARYTTTFTPPTAAFPNL